MREFFDTSVLVPAFLSDHPHHKHSLALVSQANPANSFASAHTVVELYATLTRLPPPYRLRPSQALDAVRTIARRL